MSQNVTFNGQVYVIPDLADNNWGQNVTDYLVALPQGALQKTGGSFTLAADVDFGAVYGLKAAYFKTRASNPASAGLVRLANTDTVVWRNAGNSADLALAVNGSNQLTFNGIVLESDTLPSGYIFVGNASNESTAVAMTGDVGIDNTGLTAIQNGVIINTDINASAAIAVSKLAALTASKSVVSDGSGFLSTGWAYAGGDMQTTINGALRFTDGTTNYVGLASPAAVTTHTYLLPIAAGLNGQVLAWTTGGQLAWINASGTGTINSGTAGRFAYYPSTGTTLSDQALLTTNGTNLALTSGQFLIPDGTALLPSISFAGDPDTGIYSYGANQIGFAANGAAIAYFSGLGALAVGDGTVSNPAFRFLSDLDTGMYSAGANAIGFAAGGVQICAVDSTGIKLIDGSAASPSYSFTSDTDTGMYLHASNYLGFTTGGTQRFRIQDSLSVFSVTAQVQSGLGLHLTGNDPATQNTQLKLSAYEASGANDRAWSFITGKNSDTEWGNYSLRIGPYNTGSSGHFVIGAPVFRYGTGQPFTADAATNFTELVNFSSSGYSFGGGALRSMIGDTARFQVEGTSYQTSAISAIRNTNNAGASSLVLAKTRGTTLGSVTSVQDDDALGIIYFAGADGTGVVQGASIVVSVEGTPGTNVMPTNMDFKISPVSSSTPTLAMRLLGSGTSVAFSGKGTSTNDNAAAGWIGEYVASTFSAVLDGGSGVYESFSSISLTAGDWDVSAICELRANTSGSGTGLTQKDLNELLLNTTNDSSSNPIGQRHQFRWWSSVTYNNQIFETIELNPQRVSLSSTTTIYITGMYAFSSTGRITTSGKIYARRVR